MGSDTARSSTPDTVTAAYSLALRITGDPALAAEATQEAAGRVGTDLVPLLRATRAEARRRRPRRAAPPPPVARPAVLAALPHHDWQLVERVALRGMTVTEAAADLGVSRPEVLRRLHRGLAAARVSLGDARDDANTARLERLGSDVAAGRLGDTAGDREPEPAARACVPT